VVVQLDRDRAVAMTVQTAANDPHYANPAVRASKSFGVLLSRTGYTEEAAVFFEKASAVREEAQDFFNLGTNRARLGEYEEAVSYFRRAIELEPGYAKAYINLAWAWKSLGDLENAERAIRLGVSVLPYESRCQRALGIILADGEQYDEATTVFEQAVALDSSDADCWSRLGLLYARSGRIGEARAALRRTILINPNEQRALGALRSLEGTAP